MFFSATDVMSSIKYNFNKGFFNKSMKINGLPAEYPAWTYKGNSWIAVLIPTSNEADFSEKFSNVRIKTENVTIEDEDYRVIMLSCDDIKLRNEFSSVCVQFVDPGENGSLRADLENNPENWWKKWKTLLGNKTSDTNVYPIIGELETLEYVAKNGSHANWSGINGGTHDIEFDGFSIEVKSTDARYGYEVTLSSVYQMVPSRNGLDLVFCRYEKSSNGRNIDDILSSLVLLGYSSTDLETALERKGLEKGCTARSIKYKLLEMKKYHVDENFPSITEKSFKGDVLPQNITKIIYTIDLSGLPCENII